MQRPFKGDWRNLQINNVKMANDFVRYFEIYYFCNEQISNYMKHSYLFMISLFSLGMFFSACSSQIEKGELSQDNSRKYSFSELREISLLHSEGLNTIFSQLGPLKTRSANASVTADSTFFRSKIDSMSISFIEEQMKSMIPRMRSTSNLQKGEVANWQLSPSANSIFETYFDALKTSSDRAEMEKYILSVTQSDDFLLLEEKEQQLVVFMMYIGIDSYEYWSNPQNWNKWASLRGDFTSIVPTTSTRGMAGPGANAWMSGKQINNPRFQQILRSDCVGCLMSLTRGFNAWNWAIGGISTSAKAGF
jgi:hypothetical protein